jgi:UrcA family protein
MLGSSAAMAQSDTGVTVTAPRMTHEKTNQMSNDGLGLPVERMAISYDVGYGDLNLRRKADQIELQDRISSAASRGCRELDNRFPAPGFMPMTSDNCRFNAVRDADDQVTGNLADAATR